MELRWGGGRFSRIYTLSCENAWLFDIYTL